MRTASLALVEWDWDWDWDIVADSENVLGELGDKVIYDQRRTTDDEKQKPHRTCTFQTEYSTRIPRPVAKLLMLTAN